MLRSGQQAWPRTTCGLPAGLAESGALVAIPIGRAEVSAIAIVSGLPGGIHQESAVGPEYAMWVAATEDTDSAGKNAEAPDTLDHGAE